MGTKRPPSGACVSLPCREKGRKERETLQQMAEVTREGFRLKKILIEDWKKAREEKQVRGLVGLSRDSLEAGEAGWDLRMLPTSGVLGPVAVCLRLGPLCPLDVQSLLRLVPGGQQPVEAWTWALGADQSGLGGGTPLLQAPGCSHL